jgi:hypothetical protein
MTPFPRQSPKRKRRKKEERNKETYVCNVPQWESLWLGLAARSSYLQERYEEHTGLTEELAAELSTKYQNDLLVVEGTSFSSIAGDAGASQCN